MNFTIAKHKEYILAQVNSDKRKGCRSIDINLEICNEKPKKGDAVYFIINDEFLTRVEELTQWARERFGEENVQYSNRHDPPAYTSHYLTIDNI
tara:strand:+ start:286 stop:567 length:282 start_codon:yes stop_codon:yes gene_type:complete